MNNCLCKFKINKNGFTLAEVLITLVIIGVIAAMTIPTLINKTQNQEFVSKLKKTYSTFVQATNKIISEEGVPKGSIGGWASSPENVYNMYKSRLSVAKDCGTGSGCFSQGSLKSLSGADENVSRDGSNFYKFILADGVQVNISEIWVNTNCSFNDFGTYDACARIQVDLNGAKGPNTIGRDVFLFALKENGLFPYGCDDLSYCASYQGWGCACKVLRENAMNY